MTTHNPVRGPIQYETGRVYTLQGWIETLWNGKFTTYKSREHHKGPVTVILSSLRSSHSYLRCCGGNPQVSTSICLRGL